MTAIVETHSQPIHALVWQSGQWSGWTEHGLGAWRLSSRSALPPTGHEARLWASVCPFLWTSASSFIKTIGLLAWLWMNSLWINDQDIYEKFRVGCGFHSLIDSLTRIYCRSPGAMESQGSSHRQWQTWDPGHKHVNRHSPFFGEGEISAFSLVSARNTMFLISL